MQTQHDLLFKKILGSHQNAENFLKNYLPAYIVEQLDLPSIKTEESSFVDDSLSDSYSDLLYSVNIKDNRNGTHNGYIYLLMEHKSNPDPYTPLQLLYYLVLIWKRFVSNQNESGKKGRPGRGFRKLPFILPLVFYHGERKWRYATEFSSIVDMSDQFDSKHLVNFGYILWDLVSMSYSDIKGDDLLRMFLLTMKYARNKSFLDFLPEIISMMESKYKKNQNIEEIRAILTYIFETADRVDSHETLSYIESRPVIRENIMSTIADLIRKEAREEGIIKGKLEGIMEGKLEGERMGKLESARNMLLEGISLDKVVKITGLTLEELKKAGLSL